MQRSLVLVLLAAIFVSYCGASTLHRFFSAIDADEDGLITAKEMLAFIGKTEGYKPTPEREPMLVTFLQKLLARFDVNDNGGLEWKEFKHRFESLQHGRHHSSDRHKRDVVLFTDPQQVHLSLTNKPHSEMVVMWITSVDATESVVMYGTSSQDLATSTSGVSYTYEAGVFGWNGLVHKVFLSNLTAGTQYFYKVGAPTLNVWSDVFSFKTEPLNQKEVKIATYGDMGVAVPLGFEVTKQIIADDQKIHFDLITHVGDLSYAGVSASWELEYIWDLFGEQISPLANHIPYMTAVGNHEKYYNFTSFKARFEMPGDVSGGIGNFYHSFDYGGIHFVSMCTEDYAYTYKPGSRQYQWLENDLAKANANRANTPWIFILGHRPMYSSDLSTDSGPLQQYIEPLLKQYKVDLAMWGHMHCYERTYPVYNNVPTQTSGNVYVNPTATTHLTIGTAGAMIDEKFQSPPPPWSAKRIGSLSDSYDAYGYGYLHVFNSTHLHFEFRRWYDNEVWDDLWIIKN